MAFIPVVDCVKAVIEFTAGSRQWTNTWWFTQHEFDQDNMQTLATALWAQTESVFMPVVVDDVTLTKVTIYDMSAEDAPVVTYTDDPVAGGVTGEMSPLSVALVMTFYTNARGRSGRGRIYLTGASESAIANGVYTGTFYARAQTYCEAIQSAALGLGWNHVVVSFFENNVPRAAGLARAVQDITRRSSIPGNQRRRAGRP